MTKLEELMLTVELLDKASESANGVTASIDRMVEKTQAGMKSMRKGMLALGAVATVTLGALLPAGDLYAAVGEVRSLGVAESGLEKLRHQGTLFAAEWGVNAGVFVRSAYDMQRAISTLTEDQMLKATRTAGILAKATKADVTEVTSYFGTMHGIFEKQAAQVGHAEWLENLAGKTAAAVRMFKPSVLEMQQAFEALGADAAASGRPLEEQMALLGRLQATMNGSQAGTKYQSFLQGVGKAQAVLGLNFVDESGEMLPALEILEKIEGKFGDINKVAKGDLLLRAFGNEDATDVIKLLGEHRGAIAEDIENLAGLSGMGQVVEMAEAMTTPWDRIVHGSNAVQAVIGFSSLSEAIPLLDSVADHIQALVSWMNESPRKTAAVAKLVSGFLSLSLVLSAFWTFKGMWLILQAGMAPFTWLLVKMGAALKWLRISYALLSPAIWSTTAALWASPITWVVAAVIAVGTALYFLITRWDAVTEAFRNNAFLRILMPGIYLVVEGIDWIVRAVRGLNIDWAAAWSAIQLVGVRALNFLLAPIKALGASLGGLMNLFKGLFDKVAKFAKLNVLPGLKSALGWASDQVAEIPIVGKPLYDPSDGNLPDMYSDQLAAPVAVETEQQVNRIGRRRRRNLPEVVSDNANVLPLPEIPVVGTPVYESLPATGLSVGADGQRVAPAAVKTEQQVSRHRRRMRRNLPDVTPDSANSAPSRGLLQQFTSSQNSRSVQVDRIEVNNNGLPGDGQTLLYEMEIAGA